MKQTNKSGLPSVRKKPSHDEEDMQMALCEYIQYQYPNVSFTSEASGFLKLKPYQAARAKKMRSSKGLPDLLIFHPNQTHHGLMLELKKEGTKLFLKNGDFTANAHVQEQLAVIQHFNRLGYFADFAVGIDEARAVVDAYMNNQTLSVTYTPLDLDAL